MVAFLVKSLRYYWRSHLAVLLGVFLASTVLTGALLVGDCVKASLAKVVEERQGPLKAALLGNDRFFSQLLAQKTEGTTGAPAIPLLQVLGSVADETSSVRLNEVNVLGVPPSFWMLGDANEPPRLEEDHAVLNRELAERLGAQTGDTVIARIELPGALSRDAPLSGETDATVTLRVTVESIVGPEAFGNYSLQAEQGTPLNLFVSLAGLEKVLEKPGRANVVLFPDGNPDLSSLRAAVDGAWTAEDADLHLREQAGRTDLLSDRVLIDGEAEEEARRLEPSARGVFTYLVDSIEVSETQATPYSMVTALERGPGEHGVFPSDFQNNEIVVSAWLAEDLGVEEGDDVTLRYKVFSPGRRLVDAEATLAVRAVLPMDHPAINASWTPDFPGVSDAENCRDWEPGIPVDLNRIRDKDEEYWDQYKGTPKAFISLEKGQEIWSNRFGQLTSLRFDEDFQRETFETQFNDALTPAGFGVHLLDIATAQENAVANSLEFGMYLSMFSGFLIIAAIVLTILLFALSIDQRMSQFGLLRSLGFHSAAVRRLVLLEGGGVAALGAALGVLGGLGYTKAMIWALSTPGIWQGAVGGLDFVFAPSIRSVLSGSYVIFFIAVAAMFFATRGITRRRPVSLLRGQSDDAAEPGKTGKSWIRLPSFWIAVACLTLGLGSILAGIQSEQADLQAMVFAIAGFLLLSAGVAAVNVFLRLSGRLLQGRHGLGWLGIRNSARKRGRSLGVIIVMAAGVFIICVTNAFQLDATRDSHRRDSGTGGFALLGESSLPIYENLNDPDARELYGIEDEGPFSVVPFRVREGEEANCLNLARAQRPRIIAVDPSELAERGAFAFNRTIAPVEGSPWQLLNGELDGAIPGFLDLNSALYALKVTLGDELEYTDEYGRPLRIRIVGLLQNSVCQGNVIISESNYLERFPSAGGYRFFLIDVDLNEQTDFEENVTRMLESRGLSLTPTAQRLNAFNAVQNTYLQMMSTLGGLGLLLGTLGLAVVTFRNILERRQELALMEAVGFAKRRLAWLVVSEHWFLHLSAVILGVACALLAVLPALLNSGHKLPYLVLAVLITAIFAGGLIFCWLAAKSVLRRPLLESLRTE